MKRILIVISILILLLSTLSVCCYAAEEQTAEPSVTSLSISSYPNKTVYGAFEQLDTEGLVLRAVFSDGSIRSVSGGEVRITYRQDSCLRFGDDSVTLSYGGKSISLPVTVNRIAYDLGALSLTSISAVYNGRAQSYGMTMPQIIGFDGIPLSIKASGGGVNVGTYDVTFDFSTESRDYLTPESRVISLVIEPARAEVVWEGASFVYDGKSKTPVAYYLDVNGVAVYPTVSGGATNAGEGYIATAADTDRNYVLSNTSFSYEIKKADYDFSGVVWSKDSFTYDGNKKSISLSGLPEGVSVIGYSGDRGVNAGSYTASAILDWDEANYNTPPTISHTWEIKKADYDMSGVSFVSESYTYDGKMHYPRLVGTMPVGIDGIGLEYIFSAGAAHVSDGVVSVTVSFYTSSENYNLPESRYSSVSITPRGVNVEWDSLSLEYSGEEQTPSAYFDGFSVAVSGVGLDVGKYVATATTDNTDYYILNDKAEFSITKANNLWEIIPRDSECYEGRDIVLSGKSRFGEVDYSFYSDAECTERIDTPTKCGKYYAILSVADSENYSGLTSSPIAFEIVEIRAISFLAVILKERLCAFDKLFGGDIACSVLNNDGSYTSIDPTLVEIVYENGDSFRKKDGSVILKYGDFVLSLAVEIGYADYDLSSVEWTDLTHVYDGTKKMPTLTGLPEGVSVLEYLGGQNINAGSYTVNASLSYDNENYNEPRIEPCKLTIEKCPVDIPLLSAVYSGEGQQPMSDSPLFTVENGEYTAAGTYSVLLTLTDPINYAFSGGGQTAYAVYRIEPAAISVSVSDVRLRLFEPLSSADFVITGGVVFDGDKLTVSAYKEGRRVYLRSENPNYTLEVTPGRLIRLPYPTVAGVFIMFGIALVLLFIVIAVLLIYRNRQRIGCALAVARCRWHNRDYKAPPPRNSGVINSSVNITEALKHCDEAMEIAASEENNEPCESDEQPTSPPEFEMDAEKADSLISDSLAKSLLHRDGEIVCTEGSGRAIVNVGDLSKSFAPGDSVDINSMKEKGIVDKDASYVKVLGGGKIDKQLTVYANDFSLSAIKMIALMGGGAVKILTFKQKADEKDKTT